MKQVAAFALVLSWLSFVNCQPQQLQTPQDSSLILVDEYECDAHRSLESMVMVQWEGGPLQNETLTAFQDAFVEAYNEISFTLFDAPHFRRIHNATVDASTVTENSLSLSLMVECRNCTSSLPLFTTSNLLLSLEDTPQVSISKQGEVYQDADASNHSNHCVCPKDVPARYRAPTSGEFQMALSDRLVNLTTAVNITSVQPLQPVNCSENVRQFTSFLYADFNLSGRALLPREIQAVEEAVKETYNYLAFSSCDSHFRTIQNVSLQAAPEAGQEEHRRSLTELLQSSNSTFNLTTTTMAPTSNVNTTDDGHEETLRGTALRITGECRNCPVTDAGSFALFDQMFRRTLSQMTSAKTGAKRSLFLQPHYPTNDTCVCPSEAEPQPMLLDDFVAAFNERLQEDEEILAVQALGGVLEGQQVSCGAPLMMENFQTNVYSDLTVNLTSITREEIMALEESFQTAYSWLAIRIQDLRKKK